MPKHIFWPIVDCSSLYATGDTRVQGSDVNNATTSKAKTKATYLKAKNTTTFPQHICRTINVLRSNLQSSLKISQCSIIIVIRLTCN